MGSDQRGMSISVWAAVVMPAMVLALGIGVDFSGHASAQQQAREVAAEAARIGGQQVQSGVSGLVLEQRSAYLAASDFLQNSGYALDSFTVSNGHAKATVKGAYRTRFLGLVGVTELPIRVEARAELVQVTGSRIRR